MDLLRRAIALAIFLGATYVAIEMRAGNSALGGIFFIPAVLVAFFALAVVVFNLPILGNPTFEDSGFERTVLSPWQLKVFGLFLALLFGGVPVYIAARGLFRGVIPAPWEAPDIVLAESPLRFLLAFAIFAGGGVLLAVLIVKGIWRAKSPSR